jgi:hypothetical protein
VHALCPMRGSRFPYVGLPSSRLLYNFLLLGWIWSSKVGGVGIGLGGVLGIIQSPSSGESEVWTIRLQIGHLGYIVNSYKSRA